MWDSILLFGFIGVCAVLLGIYLVRTGQPIPSEPLPQSQAPAQPQAQTSPIDTKIYASIRGGSFQTFLSVIVGVVLSILAGLIVWWAFFHFSGYLLKRDTFAMQYGRHAIGIIAGCLVGYYVFMEGVQAPIAPGQRAYLTIRGVPFGNLGPGVLWRLPDTLMGHKVVDSQAHQNISDGTEVYLTSNGMEIRIASGATVTIRDPLLAQGIAPDGDIQAYITARRKSAVRRFVGEKELTIDLAFKEDPTTEEQLDLFKQTVQIKGDVTKNGPSKVLEYMNAEIKIYGMEVTQVEFGEVLFSDTLEAKIELAFDKIAEGPGLHKDMLNKTSQVQTFINQSLEHIGLPLAQLSREEKFEFQRRAQAFVLASMGQGGYQYHDFGETPPKGVLISAQSNQPSPKGNGS